MEVDAISEFRRRLSAALSASGYPTEPDDDRLDPLLEKLELLQETGRYARLIADILSANDRSNLKSLVLEATFAFQFESVQMPLKYEVPRPGDGTSVDFLHRANSGEELCIELRLVQQRQLLTDLFEEQLLRSDYFGTELDQTDDCADTRRLQYLILEKAIDSSGDLIKFQRGRPNCFNLVAVEVSELHLGMIDIHDCRLAIYGDPQVPKPARRELFGLFQDPRPEYPEHIQKIAATFAPFRAAVHAVLFLRKVPAESHIDFRLEYLLGHNPQLVDNDQGDRIARRFKQAMNVWERYA